MAENNPAMPLILSGRVYELTIAGTLLQQRTQNQFQYQSNDPNLPPVDHLALAQAFWLAVGPFWVNAVSEDWSLGFVRVQRVDTYGSAPTFHPAAAVAGGNPIQGVQGASCPPQDAVVIGKKTTQIGKRARGRSYIAGVAEADHTGGNLTAAAVLRFASLGTSFQSGITVLPGGLDFSARFITWSHTPPSTTEVRGLPIISVPVDPVIRTQRRRQMGRGV